jgi:hypothetical protein
MGDLISYRQFRSVRRLLNANELLERCRLTCDHARALRERGKRLCCRVPRREVADTAAQSDAAS